MGQNDKTVSEIITGSFKKNIRQYTMVIALLAICVIFTVLTGNIFISPRNLSNLFLQTISVAVVAVGMTLVIVSGNIDLSVGSVAGFTGAVAAVLQVNYGWGAASAIVATLFAGLAIGAWHGFWISYQKVPAFIVTLASMLGFRGAILGITGGQTVSPMKDGFKAIGQGYLPSLFSSSPSFNDTSFYFAVVCILLFVASELRKRASRVKYGFEVLPAGIEAARLILLSGAMAAFFSIMIYYKGIPYSVILLLAVVVLFGFISENTVFGRHLYAIGGNADAAKLSGVNIERSLMKLYMIFGILTAVSGIVMTARLNAATTSAGVNMELDAIAAAVIGGTSLLGGEGTVFGAIVGALIMASLDNGMSLMNMDINYQYIIKGFILLLAVWGDIASRRR